MSGDQDALTAPWISIRAFQVLGLVAFALYAYLVPAARPHDPVAALLLGAGFVIAHVALGLFLYFQDLGWRSSVLLLDTFFTWVPVLTLGAYVGLGMGRRVAMPVRLAVLLVYGILLAVLGAISTPGTDPPNCQLEAQAALCQASPWFDLLLRFAPVPAFFFLFANGRHRWTIGQCFGLALATFTLFRGVYFSLQDLLVIAGGGVVLGPQPAIDFYRNFFIKALWEALYVVVGLFFVFRRVPGLHRPFRFGNEIERVLRPLGAWTRRSLALDAAWGATVFIPLAVGAALLGWLLSQGPTAGVGDDSAVYDEITFDLVFLLSIAAGVGEELVFRGFLQGSLERLLVFRGWPRTGLAIAGAGAAVALGTGTYQVLFVDEITGVLVGIGIATFAGVVAMCVGWGGFGIAIFLQALLFGLFHAGYGDLDHVIVPFMFGLLAGIIYRMFGLLAIILIHVEIDVFAFAASHQGPLSEPLNYALSLLFLLQFAFGAIFAVLQLLRWLEGRRKVVPIVARS